MSEDCQTKIKKNERTNVRRKQDKDENEMWWSYSVIAQSEKYSLEFSYIAAHVKAER